ncbi:MAG: hypothetical protein JKY15_00210 [Deltaproteobacteria bacterium]|nr:hypothetical protein [Deltaproteobacteria bacterium]
MNTVSQVINRSLKSFSFLPLLSILLLTGFGCSSDNTSGGKLAAGGLSGYQLSAEACLSQFSGGNICQCIVRASSTFFGLCSNLSLPPPQDNEPLLCGQCNGFKADCATVCNDATSAGSTYPDFCLPTQANIYCGQDDCSFENGDGFFETADDFNAAKLGNGDPIKMCNSKI